MIERPATREDVPALVELWLRFELATMGAGETDEGEILGDWGVPGFDPARSTVVFDDGGRLVGHAVVTAEGDCDSVVDPARWGEGLEDRLLAWLEGREVARVRALQHFWAAGDSLAVARFTRRGWHAARTYWRMRLDHDAPTAAPFWPDRVIARGLEPARDGRAAYEVIQTAFADVGDGYVRKEYDAWARSMLDPARFDPELCLVAEYEGGLAGVCLAQHTPDFAFVRQLAVPRAFRGRGIALALLRESFRRHAARGYPATVLGVDAATATGATRLYERAGMRVVEEFTRWERPPLPACLPPATSSQGDDVAASRQAGSSS